MIDELFSLAYEMGKSQSPSANQDQQDAGFLMHGATSQGVFIQD
jgi:hypothetical protein